MKKEERKNLNMYVSKDIFVKLKEVAGKQGVAFSRLAFAILKERLAPDTLTPLEKAILSLLDDK